MVLTEFTFTLNFCGLAGLTAGYNLFKSSEGAVLSVATSIIDLSCPCSLVSVAGFDIVFLEESLVSTVNKIIDLLRDLLDALLWHVSLFEEVDRGLIVRHICQQILIVFGPVLLCLFEKKAGLNLWIIFRSPLDSPPLLTLIHLLELWEFLTMNSNGYIAKFRSIIGHHLLPTILIELLASQF